MMRLRAEGGFRLWLALILPLIGGALLVWQAWTLAEVLGRAIEGGESLAVLTPGIMLVAGLLAGRVLLNSVGDFAGAMAGEAVKLMVRERLFAHMLAQPPRAADRPASGAAAAVIIEQTEALDGFFARYLPAMVQAAILPLAFGAIILPLDCLAGLLFLVTAPLIPLFMALVGWGAEIATRRQARALSLLGGRFADRLRGLLTLKLFGRAEAETADIVAASDELRRRTMKVLRIAFLSSAVLEFFAALGVAGIALYVGLTYIGFLHLRATPLTLSTGLFLLLMAPEIYNPLRLLAAHYHDRAAAKAAVEEMERVLGDLPEETVRLEDADGAAGKDALPVRLVDVQLRTPRGDVAILRDVNLTIAAGEHIAIMGPSGIGKTTLIEAMGRLRGFDGEIVLGGRVLEAWPEAELRAEVALLGQKPRMFHGSIAENIALARQGAGRAEIERAAGLAGVAGFAGALPHGLDTLLGDGGVGLSGGEAQRVALARIYLRDPGLIVLDEPTAHLDAATEQLVLDGLKRFAQGRTLVVATHSAAVAERMDRVYRIDGQRLVAAAEEALA